MSRCAAIKPDGERCKGVAIRSSEWCPSHHPDYQEQRKVTARKGGKRGGRGRPLTEIAAIKSRLKSLAEEVLSGTVDRSDAAVAGQLLNYATRCVQVGLKVKEQEELIERIEELEEVLESRTPKPGSQRGGSRGSYA